MDPPRPARWILSSGQSTGSGLPAKGQCHESVVYRIYLILSIYLSVYTGKPEKTFGACGRREKHPLDRGHGASIVYTCIY